MKKYDVIIIGMGCAGIGAFLQMKKTMKSILAIEEKRIGGAVFYANRITNMPLIKSIDGRRIVELFEKQIKKDAKIIYEKCVSIEENKDSVNVTTEKNKFLSRYTIICTGREPKEMKNVKLKMKTIGDKLKGKNICIIGGGEMAVDYSISLSERGKSVEIISTGNFLKVNKNLTNEAKIKRIKFNRMCIVNNVIKDKDYYVKFIKNNKTIVKRFSDVILCIGTKKLLPEIKGEKRKKRILFAGTVKNSISKQCSIAFADGVREAMKISEKNTE
ncbi:MAG: hypothetical protein COX48_04085 [bacterium (Candidatus Stahlbacteria) CG23_combo_of_CG06-09_8_20_14_all_34_7]|nr:MAG: hypothetical protein COX48_04085 [bacterium (Candidatus Stahlbacteria) CG23_combo_of_CG06-09_8_20_14_all_34_7]